MRPAESITQYLLNLLSSLNWVRVKYPLSPYRDYIKYLFFFIRGVGLLTFTRFNRFNRFNRDNRFKDNPHHSITMVRKTQDEKRKDAREYMATYREHNPTPRNYNVKGNEKRKKLLKSLPSIECKCGGKYKNFPQSKQKHLESYKHQVWYAEKQLTALMVSAGEAKDEATAKRQLEKRFNTRCAYTDKSKVIAMDDIGENINNIMKAKKHKKEATPRPKTKETHHEKMIRIAAEAQESESSDEEEPHNEIIEAEKSPPPTPCPSNSEGGSESEEIEHTDEDTDTQSENTESECSDDDELNEIHQHLNDEKEIALKRFNRFKEVAPPPPSPPASPPPPPPSPPKMVDMSDYLEEASKTDNDGSDILKKLGLLTEDRKGKTKYHFL